MERFCEGRAVASMQRSGIEEPHNTDVTLRDCTSLHRGYGTPGVILGAAGNPETCNDQASLMRRSLATDWIPAFGEYDANFRHQ
ncbi:MAG: hypothetical protein ABL985_15045 [Casimicrobium sp.]